MVTAVTQEVEYLDIQAQVDLAECLATLDFLAFQDLVVQEFQDIQAIQEAVFQDSLDIAAFQAIQEAVYLDIVVILEVVYLAILVLVFLVIQAFQELAVTLGIVDFRALAVSQE